MNKSQDALTREPPLEETRDRAFVIPMALLIPSALALATGIFGYFNSSIFALPVQSFYGTAAQIIPILIVAFAVESRASQLFADPKAKVYRVVLFAFLSVGELCALAGSSGVLRGGVSGRHGQEFEVGVVAESFSLSNVIAAGTAAGLVGGFVMIAVLAVGGPGWLGITISRGHRSRANTVDAPVAATEEVSSGASSTS